MISCFPTRNTTFFLSDFLPVRKEGTRTPPHTTRTALAVSPATQLPQTHDARHTRRHILRAGNLQATIIYEPPTRATHDESTRSQTHSRKTHSREHTPDNARRVHTFSKHASRKTLQEHIPENALRITHERDAPARTQHGINFQQHAESKCTTETHSG